MNIKEIFEKANNKINELQQMDKRKLIIVENGNGCYSIKILRY